MTEEMGKVISEARGDVQEAIDMTFYMAGEGRRLYGQTTPSELPNKFNMSVRKPIGVAGIITPWNFPMAIPSWKMTPALVAGNTIVFKPASFTPRMAVRWVEVLQEAGIPDGVVNLVIGGGEDVGNAIVDHPDVALISFTGSTDTGVKLASRAAALNKRVSLEMGGKNAVDRARRCQSRSGGRRHSLERVRHVGAAMHGGEPSDRAARGAARSWSSGWSRVPAGCGSATAWTKPCRSGRS